MIETDSDPTVPQLYYRGESLDMSPQCLGQLRESTDVLDDADELRRRMTADGYLLLHGYLDRDQVIEARLDLLQRLADEGALDSGHPVAEGVMKPSIEVNFSPEIAVDNPALDRVLYSGLMIDFFERFLGGEVAHFDYTWFRSKSADPAAVSDPHCDVLYMSRGETRNRYTSWTPLGNVPYEMGGLMNIFEKCRRFKMLGMALHGGGAAI